MPTIDLAFELVGTTVPLDHGYALFSALCKVVPALHGDERVGVHPFRGRQSAPGVLNLTQRSRLRLRLPTEEIAPYIAIAGACLVLEGHRIRIGIPRVEPLLPSANLAARLVTFRNSLDPELAMANITDSLAKLGLQGEARFVPSRRTPWIGQPLRRVLRVKDKRIVGYAVRVIGMNAEDSLRLQEEGLGGRRRFGCGVFVPVPKTEKPVPGG
jgi:CRISPR-associated protein Cas6